MLLNKKSILLASAIALGCYGTVQAQPSTQEITINFEGWVGDKKFVCGKSYKDVGTSQSTVTPSDFRLYVSSLALIDEAGNAVEVELEQDGKWQHQNVALLDFENGSAACSNGTSQTRTMVKGTVPEGDYQDLQFTLGVPKNLNHKDAALAASPLNLTSMWWNWQGGYKFLRVDLENDQEISAVNSAADSAIASETEPEQSSASTSTPASAQTERQPDILNGEQSAHGMKDMNHQSNTMEHNGHDMKDMNHQASSNGYLIHLGSTGCKDSAQSNLFGCANPNRSKVVLEDFDSQNDVVIADLAELLAQTDLASNEVDTPAGCMSSPDDSDCNAIIQNLGLSSAGSATTEQKLFWVE